MNGPLPRRPYDPTALGPRDYSGYFTRGLVAGGVLAAVQGRRSAERRGGDLRRIARRALQEGTAIAAGARAAVAVYERDYASALMAASAGAAGIYLLERLLPDREQSSPKEFDHE